MAAVSQFVIFEMVLSLLRLLAFDVFQIFDNSLFKTVFLILWIISFYAYFTTRRVNNILILFEAKSEAVKKLWGIITFCSIAIPIVVCIYAINKYFHKNFFSP